MEFNENHQVPTTKKKKLDYCHIRTLEASFEAASGRFGTYNFREYFARKVRHKFDRQLPAILGTSSTHSVMGVVDEERLANADGTTRDKLLDWWQSSLDELAVLERASIMNRLFEAPHLVVEQAPNFGSSPAHKTSENPADPLSKPKA
ncbi:hypothetical protein VP01_323g9 [Puccinia sorghi]|uniref:Uncharacterized protein n=1 Tax=Puccinia sorghi TaxID=27349 RepID=A0A0L6UYY6_9BASI|nr:hypothetical protein VP01_323g9 [Puccinia sorghi]